MAKEALGARALVIGAGVGGLLAAGALSRHFREVTILEKDVLPSESAFRKGVAQGPHGHVVLKRGENVAEAFFPGFREALRAAGGIELQMGLDMARYTFGKWSKPIRSGINVSFQTRALLEHVLRQSLLSRPNVAIRTQKRFSGLTLDGGRVQGVVVMGPDRAPEQIAADLVVDASGRGTATPRWLEDHGFGTVHVERLGIDVCYVTGLFATDGFDDGRPRVCTVAQTPPAGRGGAIMPVEGSRWMVTLIGRGDDVPSTEMGEFMDFAKSLPDSCVYERIAGARLEGRLRRFKTPESFWRRYERMPEFPEGLIPIGDAVAGFNPLFAQGMSVAAVDAEHLANLLAARADSGAGLRGLHRDFLPKVSEAVEEAWEATATFDMLYDTTRGERPKDYPQRRAIFLAMQELADEDEDLRRAQLEVQNMLAPRTSLFSAEIMTRLQERLGNQQASEPPT